MSVSPRFLQLHAPDGQALAAEAAAGLAARPARLSPKFLYDPLGSRLFEAITELPEYYPTRTEAAILQAHGAEIVAAALEATGPAPALVDLGAGNCRKAASLFAPLRPRHYVAIDISVEYLKGALGVLQREHPGIAMTGVGLDFSAGLRLPAGLVDGRALAFYPGSSIGNFGPAQALRLLRELREASAGGALLIGADLVKPVEVLEAAYDDALGVTAAFNLNLLHRMNALLGADFRVRDWRHVALFDASASRIEMHLEARSALRVCWRGGERAFAAGERIHTEDSWKWSPADFATLLASAGFERVRRWTDPRQWFGVFLASG